LGPSLLDPPTTDSKGRRMSSSVAVQASRIEKSYPSSSSRDFRKKSEQGLRRKSLVSAALASMAEKDC
jgi:hypothetical protein